MKKLILITISAVSITTSAYAGQQNSLGGLIIGAGSGALMGQAIGRDTESTLVGTAVGSVIGYIIGNEMDKDSQIYYRPAPRQPAHYKPAPHRPVVHHEKYVTTHHYHYGNSKPYRPRRQQCKEAEILGTVHGKAKKIYGTVCRTDRGWELVSEDPNDGHDRYSRKKSWQRKWPAKGHHRDRRYDHWVRHRF
jgi:surface antigen